jgi:hypothetical protein
VTFLPRTSILEQINKKIAFVLISSIFQFITGGKPLEGEMEIHP